MDPRCIAAQPDGIPCGAPALLYDEQRGGLVCWAHAQVGPLQRRVLRHTIHRAMRRPERYLAATLAEWPDTDLAAELGCPVEQIWRLRLAGWPRAEHWEQDLTAMAAAVGCQPDRLAMLLQRLGASGA